MPWVLSRMVVPSLLKRMISLRTRSALIGSKPLKGSSRINNFGLCITVVMNCTFCAIPLLNSSTFLFHQPVISQRSNQSFSLDMASAFVIPFKRAR